MPNANGSMVVPRPEHPRPQVRRERWVNLNGPWEFEVDQGDSGMERGLLQRPLRGRIIVPFAPETPLSGVGETDFMRAVWYRRSVDVPADWEGQRMMVHFQAVDYDATVWANGVEVGRHRGGYSGFSCDLGDVARAGEALTLVVRARDEPERTQPRGKQSDRLHPYRCVYPRTTGIWQTVWLEPVPTCSLGRPRVTPDVARGAFRLEQPLLGPSQGLHVEAVLRDAEGVAASGSAPVGLDMTPVVDLPVPPERRRLWSPEDPHLYDLDVRLLDREGAVVDSIASYAGMRSVGISEGALTLNGEARFQRLVLDQGYWPEGGLTAPDDEALVRDIVLAKSAGFDGARAHERVAEERWLYHADRLGYLVWGELPDWGNRARGRHDADELHFPIEYATQWLEALHRDYSHPCIVGWCGLNETGQAIDDRITELDDATLACFLSAKAADRTRPVLDASGYSHRVQATDVWDCHDYEQDPGVFAAHYAGLEVGEAFENRGRDGSAWSLPWRGQPYLVSEFGGARWVEREGHDDEAWGYGDAPRSVEELAARFGALCGVLLGHERVAGYCYTQLTDTYQEANGILTFDRRPKVELATLAALQRVPAAIEQRLRGASAGR